jgi:hypothetical protein
MAISDLDAVVPRAAPPSASAITLTESSEAATEISRLIFLLEWC